MRHKSTKRDFSNSRIEQLEPRYMFSASPITTDPQQPDLLSAPSIDHHSSMQHSEEQQGQSLTNWVWQPMVFAGSNASVSENDSLQLNAEVLVNRASDLSVSWSVVSGQGIVLFEDSAAAVTTVSFSEAGSYELELTVINHDIVVSDRISVVVEESSLSKWNDDMLQFALQHGEALRVGYENGDSVFANTYYDAARVFYQIADYTGDSSWNQYAEIAAKSYRDEYVLPNNGTVPGYWHFTRGLTMHYLRTGDTLSRDAAVLLSQNASYAGDSTPLSWTDSQAKSREVAYAINSYLDSESIGVARRDRLEPLFEQALGHLDQWFVDDSVADYAPFMFGLTSEALINYYNQVDQDPRILESIELGINQTWDQMWSEEDQSFFYRANDTSNGKPDLNALIAPAYEWVYSMTGNSLYRERADKIFSGGVEGAWLSGAKQFNQNYRWSFEFVQSRYGVPAPTLSNSQAAATPSVFSSNTDQAAEQAVFAFHSNSANTDAKMSAFSSFNSDVAEEDNLLSLADNMTRELESQQWKGSSEAAKFESSSEPDESSEDILFDDGIVLTSLELFYHPL